VQAGPGSRRAKSLSPRPRLLEALEVVGEVLLGVEGRAVDAREHLAARVAAPVGARDAEQLERLDAVRGGGVRPAAEVGEGAVRVQGHGVDARVADQVLDQLDLVVLPLAREAVERRAGRDVLALERLGRLDVLAHPGLERLEVGVGDRDAVGELEVVVEAVLDRRPDRDLRPGIEVEHRGGQHVRRVVADEVERVLAVARGDDRDLVAVGQRPREVAKLPADLHGERRAGQPRPDGGRQLGARGAIRELLLRAVGKDHVHGGPDARRRRAARGGAGGRV